MLENLIETIIQEIPEISNSCQQILGTIVDFKQDPAALLDALVKTCQARFHVSF